MELAQFHYQTLPGPGYIRLVTILPGERGSDLRLQLEYVRLNPTLSYECLSYAWGPVGHGRTITLNNSAFLISSTLHTAIEHLRCARQERKMWIDAISICQANIEERSQQVAIMRTIYKNATRVVVWLGPATESSEQAMSFLKTMGAAERNSHRRRFGQVNCDTSSESGPDEDEKRERSTHKRSSSKANNNGLHRGKSSAFWKRLIHYSTKNDFVVTGFSERTNHKEYFSDAWLPHWRALDELLDRTWWSRTWVVQEVWSASRVLIQCGSTTIKWTTFQQAMSYSEAWDEMGDSVRGTQREQHWAALRRRYTLAIHLAKERANGRALSTLLVTTWDRASTDPRDKVFAMLSLAGEHEHVSMKPDYTKSTEQVYREAARDIIVNHGQMDILLAASGIHQNDGLPTWVPDWRRKAFTKKPTLLVNRHLMLRLLYGGSMSSAVLEGHGYRAAGNSKPLASFSNNLSVLTVRSQKIDVIAEVCEADIATMQDDDFLNQAFDFILRSEFVPASTRQHEADVRTQSDAAKDTSTLFATLTGGGKIPDDNWASIIRNVMQRRRLFVTRDGRFGIAPLNAQPADVVVLISGCNFPIVLRAAYDAFVVVGEAYRKSSNQFFFSREHWLMWRDIQFTDG
ncbi:heterokaryon incompatibility protein-domain-containing protein [Ampelomyces quisqualis]|uniref:Heterokaryon incompatibility protein-domain-containing protein n=1 Tax=Ampelomyces quisqualis TaxID=50730 RepID=A0A6A5QXG8_AMPQU|nr:heterokaryon incompatibility protein-domain-containing protein [Ampelomyces quisqualis]